MGTVSRWLDVQGLQAVPIDLGLDGNGRAQFSLNVVITKEPSLTVDDEVETVLLGAGISASVIFVGSKAVVPGGTADALTVTLTGGGGIRTHNFPTRYAYEQPTVQLLGRSVNPTTAKGLVLQARDALFAVKNTVVSP